MLENQIKELRKKGRTYTEIKNALNCSIGLVCYYLGSNQKSKARKREQKRKGRVHPYERKIEQFAREKSYKQKAQLKSTINKIIYDKIRAFCMKQPPTFTIQDVIDKFGDSPKCYLTGKEIDIYDTKSYQFDHVIPRSRGGSNTLDNLGICTKDANQAKRDMLPAEFIQLCQMVVKHNK